MRVPPAGSGHAEIQGELLLSALAPLVRGFGASGASAGYADVTERVYGARAFYDCIARLYFPDLDRRPSAPAVNVVIEPAPARNGECEQACRTTIS